MRRFEGQGVFVTGAAHGIGAAIVRAFAGEGACVAITDLDGEAAEALAADLGAGCRAWALDVTRAGDVGHVFEEAVTAIGPISVVVANAGVSTMNPVIDLTEDEWDFNMDVNAKGVFLPNQAAVRHFLSRGMGGSIVNTASLAGKVGAPLLAHYSASKFAVVGFTQALAREMAKQGIRVNAVCPGYVVTGMQDREVVWEGVLRGLTPDEVRAQYLSETPLGRLARPEDVARVVVFLASDDADYMTGQAINVTGGIRMD